MFLETETIKQFKDTYFERNIKKFNILMSISFFHITFGRRKNIMSGCIIDTSGHLLQVWEDEEV